METETYDLMPHNFSNTYSLSLMDKQKALFIGIGGGSDVIGAYAIASILQSQNSSAKISYGLCVSAKNKYSGFDKLSKHLFQRSSDIPEDIDELSTSLSLVIKMKEYERNISQPYLLVRPPKYEKVKPEVSHTEYEKMVREAFQDALNIIEPDIIFAIDMGGDSLTCGEEDEYGFDRTGLRALQQLNKSFIYIVLGPGCDGESTIEMIRTAIKHQAYAGSLLGEFDLNQEIEFMSPISRALLDPKRTPNIIADAKAQLDKFSKNTTSMITIPRHRQPNIPLNWLIKGIVFEGSKLSLGHSVNQSKS